jgi:hypothetical protein
MRKEKDGEMNSAIRQRARGKTEITYAAIQS